MLSITAIVSFGRTIDPSSTVSLRITPALSDEREISTVSTVPEAVILPFFALPVVLSSAPISVASRDAGDYYRIESQSVVLRVYKRPLRFALFDKANASVIWQETKPLTYGPSTVQTLKRGDNENFYGGGMQNGYFSHRDTSVNIRLNTRGWGDGTTPNPAPFYMSTAGYGVFRRTMAPGRYDFAQPLALAHDEKRFDAYYFFGPSLKKVLDGYTLVTGRPFFPPRWGLEWGDADCYNKTGKTPDVISKVADKYRAAGKTRGRRHVGHEIEEDVVQLSRVLDVTVVITEVHFLLPGVERIGTVALHGSRRCLADQIVAAETQDMIPDGLQALFIRAAGQDGERRPAHATFDTPVLHLGGGGAFAGIFGHPVRHGGRTTAGIDIELEGLRVSAEQGLLPFRQLVRILVHVLRRNGEGHLVTGKRVRTSAGEPAGALDRHP